MVTYADADEEISVVSAPTMKRTMRSRRAIAMKALGVTPE